jgi:hypothetical protein
VPFIKFIFWAHYNLPWVIPLYTLLEAWHGWPLKPQTTPQAQSHTSKFPQKPL